ncbi:MAG: hypothetical protein CFE45_28580, partial [Burkholderiales bacterium PBB5]
MAGAFAHIGRTSAVLRVALFDGNALQAVGDCVLVHTGSAAGPQPVPDALRAALTTLAWRADAACPAICARFVDDELVPDDEAARKRGNVGHAVWRKAGELGLLCTDVPEQYGGAGGDFRHEAVLYEECARRGISGWANSVHTIVAHYFLNHGTEAQKQKYLPRLARGELVGAIAMTEP